MKKLNTSPYFDYEVQKLCSIIASMATMAFNNAFCVNAKPVLRRIKNTPTCTTEENRYATVLERCISNGAMFDTRVFSIPKDEVVNLLYWRQLDATRNSIQMVGQANFSHKQLQDKNCNDIQDMLMLEKGINWNDYPTTLKRGSCCIKKPFKINEDTNKETIRNKWIIDTEIPIFTQDKDYVNKLVMI